MNTTTPTTDIHDLVRRKYGEAAKAASKGSEASCCVSTCGGRKDPITSDLYEASEIEGIPVTAVLASLGCGNPTALASLAPGEVVLDLGSGGGIDVLLSAQRVGPAGHAYGLDMTDEMLTLARKNAVAAGAENVTFLKGQIEQIPLPDNSVDVIISNCVINLAADKPRVLREAFRVLRPGGRFAVSDVVVRGEVPPDVRRSLELWVGCIAGALEEKQFIRLLEETGFLNPSIEATRVYAAEDARAFLSEAGLDAGCIAGEIDGAFCSAFVRAVKPGTSRSENIPCDSESHTEGMAMEKLSSAERELVAIGAALGSNCVPCIEYHIPEARKAGLSDRQIGEALRLADKVRQVPAKKVLAAALGMLPEADVQTEARQCGAEGIRPAPADGPTQACCS